MILSLLPVSNRKLPIGCTTTKNPTGTVIWVLGAPDWSALLAIVNPPELNAWSFMPAGPAACDSVTTPTSMSATTTPEIRPRAVRFMSISSGVREPRLGVSDAKRNGEISQPSNNVLVDELPSFPLADFGAASIGGGDEDCQGTRHCARKFTDPIQPWTKFRSGRLLAAAEGLLRKTS